MSNKVVPEEKSKIFATDIKWSKIIDYEVDKKNDSDKKNIIFNCEDIHGSKIKLSSEDVFPEMKSDIIFFKAKSKKL